MSAQVDALFAAIYSAISDPLQTTNTATYHSTVQPTEFATNLAA